MNETAFITYEQGQATAAIHAKRPTRQIKLQERGDRASTSQTGNKAPRRERTKLRPHSFRELRVDEPEYRAEQEQGKDREE